MFNTNIFSPLDQFEIRDLLSINALILNNFSITLTNIALCLPIIIIICVLIIYINFNKVKPLIYFVLLIIFFLLYIIIYIFLIKNPFIVPLFFRFTIILGATILVYKLIAYFIKFCLSMLKKCNFGLLPLNSHKYISNIMKQSCSKAIIISIFVSGLGSTTITILGYNDYISYIRSLIPNILLPSYTTRNSFNIPSFNWNEPKLFIKDNLLNKFSEQDFNLFYNAKWAIASNNIHPSVLDILWNLFHNNLPMFMGMVGILLYSFLPAIGSKLNSIINWLHNSNNTITVYIMNLEEARTRTANFLRRLNMVNANRHRATRIANSRRHAAGIQIAMNRHYLAGYFARLIRESGTFSTLLNQLYTIGINYRQDSDGTSTISINYSMLPYISFQQMLELNPILYNQIMDLNNRLELLSQSISGVIFDIARLLGQNSSMYENILPNEQVLDDLDFRPEIVNYINSVNMYDLETFESVFNESKEEYNFNE